MENLIEQNSDLILVIHFIKAQNRFSNELAFLYYINFYKWFGEIDGRIKNRNMIQDYYLGHKDKSLYCFPGDLKCLFRHKTMVKNYISYNGRTSAPPCQKEVKWLIIKDSDSHIALNKRDIENTVENVFMYRHYSQEQGNVNENVNLEADLASSEDRSVYQITEVVSDVGLGCEPGFYESFVAKKQSDMQY